MAIAERDGRITPAAVLEEARDPESVLHGAFTWDDTVAAERWRIHEAQKLIRECRVTVERPNGTRIETYAFVGVSTDRTGPARDNPYRLARDLAYDDDLLDQAVRDVLDQLAALKNRYSYLRKLESVWNAIDALRQES